jgi:hypothetical protein
MLETGSLDIGFLRLPIGEHSALDVVTVHRERFVLVVPQTGKKEKGAPKRCVGSGLRDV